MPPNMNTNTIDLHIHSTFSDGTLSPGELIEKASAMGITALALTDHDTVAGVEIFKKLGRKNNLLRIISGVELSVWHDDLSIHLLGYGFDPKHPSLQAGLDTIQRAREVRNRGILEKLDSLGISISYDELDYLAQGQIGRPHFAKVLLEKGFVNCLDEAFGRYLGKKGKAYVARKKFPASQAIEIIKEAGGVTVLAHPGTLDPQYYSLPGLMSSLKKVGLDGLEVYHPSHSAYMANKLLSLGRKESLLLTCGTDYHAKPEWEELLARISIPESLNNELVNWLKTVD